MSEIIDFHTHANGFENDKPFNKYHISHVISIPFGSPNGRSWKELIQIAGMKPKPTWYEHFLKNDLPSVNRLRYENITTANNFIASKSPYFIFVPWISVLTDIDTCKRDNWFASSPMIKLIPVFDHMHQATDREAVEFHHVHHNERNFSEEDSYLPSFHHVISQLPQKVIMIHTGWESKPMYYKNLISYFPDKIFILAHMKEDTDADNLDRIAIMEKYPNVYLEMSYLSSPKRLAQYVDRGFGDRILFGSDYRTPEDECTLQWMIQAVNLAPISNVEKQKIFADNAKNVLHTIGIDCQ